MAGTDARQAYAGDSDVLPELPLEDTLHSVVLQRALAGDEAAQAELVRRRRQQR